MSTVIMLSVAAKTQKQLFQKCKKKKFFYVNRCSGSNLELNYLPEVTPLKPKENFWQNTRQSTVSPDFQGLSGAFRGFQGLSGAFIGF
jgi:hypothetical protein